MNAIHWITALNLRAKLVLLLAPALLGMLALGGMLLSNLNEGYAMARQERDGLTPLRELQSLVRLTQQHRGLSASSLSGDTTADAQRADRARSLDAAMKTFEPRLRAATQADTHSLWVAQAAQWQELRAAVEARSLSAKQAIERHTALINLQLGVMDRLLFDTQLILDPTPDGYSLVAMSGQHLPMLAERLGQLRGRGASALASRSLSPQDAAQLVSLLAQAQAARRAADTSLAQATRHNAALGERLKPVAEDAAKSMAALEHLVRSQLLDAEALAMPPGEYFAQATAVIDAQFKFLEAASRELESMLSARAEQLLREMLLSAVAIALAMLATAWLGVAVGNSLLRGFNHAVKVSEGLAAGRLDLTIEVQGRDEVAKLMQAMATTQAALRDIVGQVRQGVDGVTSAAMQIAMGNADLEMRTQQQAGSVARTAETMQQMTTSVRESASDAGSADALAGRANAVAARGSEVVHQVIGTMAQISASSSRIADIIGLIDGLAFQTNILALNAAVEAARAGEQGRGFAVVAGEVRNLAQRSAGAAREIKQLIGESVERVASGSTAVREAGGTIEDMVAQVRDVAALISRISSASHRQSADIAQVDQVLAELQGSTRENATLVEQSAVAARSLQAQADMLLRRVAVFQLGDDA